MNKTYPQFPVTLQSLPLLNEPATAKDRRLCLRPSYVSGNTTFRRERSRRDVA